MQSTCARTRSGPLPCRDGEELVVDGVIVDLNLVLQWLNRPARNFQLEFVAE
jgi:hypothetical protein